MVSPNVILMNGASSSGKSTLGSALKHALPKPYFYLSSDQFVDAGILPAVDRNRDDLENSWSGVRHRFFDAFHRTVHAFAAAGNLLIVEHVVERLDWFVQLVDLLKEQRVLYVGVYCPVEELERREKLRGNRAVGEAQFHLDSGIHTWSGYDVEIDTFAHTTAENLDKIKAAIENFKTETSVFRKAAEI